MLSQILLALGLLIGSGALAAGPARVDSLNAAAARCLSVAPDSAFRLAKAALRQAAAPDYPAGLATGHLLIGQVFAQQGAFTQALDYHLRAQHHFARADDVRGLARNDNCLGSIYYYSKQPALARRSYTSALRRYEALGGRAGRAETLGHLGHLCEKQQRYAEALRYQREALALYEALRDSVGTGRILENIGSILEDEGDYVAARGYFRRAYALNRAARQPLAVVSNLNNLGDTYRKTGRYPEAIRYTRRALALADSLGQKYQVSSAYRDLGKIYHLMSDYANAYLHADRGRRLYEEIYTQESAAQLALLQTLYETEKKNQAIEALEREKQLAYATRGATLGGIVLLALLGAVVFSRQRLKLRKNAELLAQNERLYRSELENQRLSELRLQTELENKRLREQQLSQELETRSKALTSHALHLVQKNQVLEHLRDELKTTAGGEQRQTARQVRQLVRQIDQSFHQDKDWQEFRRSFEQVHESFFENLRRHCPRLTPTELRLSALIRLNLSSKDIATSMGISTDSLRTTRYRLRKKLDLPTGTNLSAFLQQL